MPTTTESLFLLLIFILPGFILANVYNRNISRPYPKDYQFVIESIGFSTFNHLVAYFFTNKIYIWYSEKILFDKYPHYFGLWIFGVVFILPILLGLIFSKIVELEPLQNILDKIGLSIAGRTSQSWDYFFEKNKACWMIIYLETGEKIGGIFGQKSFVSLTPNPKDIYLEAAYEVKEDGTFGSILGDSFGVWVNGDKIKKIEFFKK